MAAGVRCSLTFSPPPYSPSPLLLIHILLLSFFHVPPFPLLLFSPTYPPSSSLSLPTFSPFSSSSTPFFPFLLLSLSFSSSSASLSFFPSSSVLSLTPSSSSSSSSYFSSSITSSFFPIPLTFPNFFFLFYPPFSPPYPNISPFFPLPPRALLLPSYSTSISSSSSFYSFSSFFSSLSFILILRLVFSVLLQLNAPSSFLLSYHFLLLLLFCPFSSSLSISPLYPPPSPTSRHSSLAPPRRRPQLPPFPPLPSLPLLLLFFPYPSYSPPLLFLFSSSSSPFFLYFFCIFLLMSLLLYVPPPLRIPLSSSSLDPPTPRPPPQPPFSVLYNTKNVTICSLPHHLPSIPIDFVMNI